MKKHLLILGLLFLVNLVPAPVRAAELNVKSCPQDYYAFILKVRGPGMRREYMKDFFRSYCKVNDIIKIYERMDVIRDAFRKDSLVGCSNTTKYKEEYVKLLMEITFIREVGPESDGTSDTKSVENLEAQKATILANLKSELTLLFVDEQAVVSERVFNSYFEEWSTRYSDRIVNYASCPEGPWADVNEVFENFMDDWKEVEALFDKDSYKNPGLPNFKDLLKPDMPMDEETKSILSKIKTTSQKAWAFLIADRKKRSDESDPATTVSDLSKAAAATGNTLTLQGALDSLNEDSIRFLLEDQSHDRMSRYQALYGQNGAQIGTNLQGIIHNISITVDTLNRSVLPQMDLTAAKIYDKQCR